MLDVEVIEDPAAAAVALDPVRSRLLAELAEPGSAAALAARVGIPRQKVNYHLRALEAQGLVELAEERRRGGITERVMRATAARYVVSPAALGETAVDPDQADRLSAHHLIALAGRIVREVAASPGAPRPRASACPRCRSTPRSASGRPTTAPRSRTTSRPPCSSSPPATTTTTAARTGSSSPPTPPRRRRRDHD